MGSTKSELARCIYEQGDPLVRLARAIHADPELAVSAFDASARLVEFLCDNGFEIRIGICGLATAFIASRGAGALRLTLCADYDSLDGGVGHGSGHHLVAGATVGAAVGVAPFADDLGLTVSVLGTPGAELPRLLAGGAFDGTHAVLMIVPTAAGLTPRVMEYLPNRELRRDAPLRRAFARNAAALGLTAQIGTRDFAARSDTDDAYQEMLHAAVALAWTTFDAATARELRAHLMETADTSAAARHRQRRERGGR
ncbi:MAG TPA: hypothetical protein VFV20_00825 [Candidatus Limnocylindria bacterium]|nr:hypothetical protein [Candidatus Limnocylindria bacterium]